MNGVIRGMLIALISSSSRLGAVSCVVPIPARNRVRPLPVHFPILYLSVSALQKNRQTLLTFPDVSDIIIHISKTHILKVSYVVPEVHKTDT